VNAGWVEVVTAESRKRLVDLQPYVDPADVGPPTYFISHACERKQTGGRGGHQGRAG
jgi:hypothetical protein